MHMLSAHDVKNGDIVGAPNGASSKRSISVGNKLKRTFVALAQKLILKDRPSKYQRKVRSLIDHLQKAEVPSSVKCLFDVHKVVGAVLSLHEILQYLVTDHGQSGCQTANLAVTSVS